MQRKYLILIGVCLFIFVTLRFVNYISNNTNTYEKAPILQGRGTVEKIDFIPEHDEKKTYSSGRSARTRTITYHVQDAYSIKVHIDEENKTGAFHTYVFSEGSRWKQGDKVKVEYKRIKTFFFTPAKIYVTNLTKL